MEVASNYLENPHFLGAEVSQKLVFDDGDKQRRFLLRLPELQSFSDVADFVGITTSQLLYLVIDNKLGEPDHYERFSVPKRSGGHRLISSPRPYLAAAQKKIRAEILPQLDISPAAMAFRPGRSIVDNAKAHVGSKVLVRIDIKDFFPSVSFAAVRDVFEGLGYNGGVSTVLALLCTDRPRSYVNIGNKYAVANGARGLPQGACTSPEIANAVFAKYDQAFTRLAAEPDLHWRYTRYADDLVFSSTKSNPSIGLLFNRVAQILYDSGYKVNQKKTRIQRGGSRILVTGLAIEGERVFIPREMHRKIRAFLHRYEQMGPDAFTQEIGKSATDVAKGYLSFVEMVEPAKAVALRRQHPWLNW